MSNLVDHATTELKLIGYFDESSDYGGMIGPAVVELMEAFAKQGHSGMSASIVRSLFGKLADFKPLSPLTFNEDEWNNVHEETYQNKRNSSVFKDGIDGRPYHGGAYSMTGDGLNSSWSGSLSLIGGGRVGRCYIKDAGNIPEITIQIPVKYTCDDWFFLPASEDVLDELKKFYDVEILDEK